jgi:hypothetical protein
MVPVLLLFSLFSIQDGLPRYTEIVPQEDPLLSLLELPLSTRLTYIIHRVPLKGTPYKELRRITVLAKEGTKVITSDTTYHETGYLRGDGQIAITVDKGYVCHDLVRYKLGSQKGDSWKYETRQFIKVTVVHQGTKTVVTPAGSYEAIQLRCKIGYSAEYWSDEDYFYAPHVGLVKWEIKSEGNQETGELEGHRVGDGKTPFLGNWNIELKLVKSTSESRGKQEWKGSLRFTCDKDGKYSASGDIFQRIQKTIEVSDGIEARITYTNGGTLRLAPDGDLLTGVRIEREGGGEYEYTVKATRDMETRSR